MSGDWIKMRVDLADDPAVIAIGRKLKLSSYDIVGRLHVLWAWADSHTDDGRIDGVDLAWIDRKLEKRGFAAALIDVGWLEADADGITFPRFGRHNGRSAKARAEDAKRKQEERLRPKDSGQMSGKCPDKNRTELGPEKRREELNPGVGVSSVSTLRDAVDNLARKFANGPPSTPRTDTATPLHPKPDGDISPERQHPRATPKPGWHRTNEGIDEAARAVGIQAKPGEDYPSLKDRVFKEIHPETRATA